MLAPLISTDSTNSANAVGWNASLNLVFDRRSDCTDLRFKHEGPLRIQKPLYPDGPECCHAVVIHPPGGIAGGDVLQIDVSVASEAHAVISTPSAAKWYGSFDQKRASQRIEIDLYGCLEWLPSETIVFDRADVESVMTIGARDEARMIGWDLLIFGRQGSGERFESGCFDQTLKVTLGDETVWIDRLRLGGSDPLFESPIGLGGNYALATCWVIAPESEPWSEDRLDSIRSTCGSIAWTRLHPRLLIGRQVGCPIQMHRRMQQAWRFIKQSYWKLPANDLRLWAT